MNNSVKLEPRTTEWNQSLYKDYTWSTLYRNGVFPNCTLKLEKSLKTRAYMYYCANISSLQPLTQGVSTTGEV